MMNWGEDDVRRLTEEAKRALPAEVVASFLEEVRFEALHDRHLPLAREDKKKAKRLKRDVEAIGRTIEIVADDAALVRRLKVERELASMSWQRAARAKEANLPTRQSKRKDALVDQFCRSIARSVGCHVGELKPGRSPSDGNASGVVPLVAAALTAVGYQRGLVTVYQDVLTFIEPYRLEAEVREPEVDERPKFLADE